MFSYESFARIDSSLIGHKFSAEVKSTETPKVKSSQGKDVKKEKEKTEVSQKKMKEASGVEGAVAGSLTSSLATESKRTI